MLSPVILFAYKRPNELKMTIEALKANYLAPESDLYVFIDGPRKPEDIPKVEQVRKLVSEITGFKSVKRFIGDTNKGCAQSIISGVTQVLNEHESVVVVEDDIVTTPNFLDFINQGLEQYKNNKKVFSIGGYSFPFPRPLGYEEEGYFIGRTCAWGWGIWADRWQNVDWKVADYESFMNDKIQRKQFNYFGSDRVKMLRKAVTKEIDTWDILLCYTEFKLKGLTLYPVTSKVENIGFISGEGSHTNVFNRYKTKVDQGAKRLFNLPNYAEVNGTYSKLFRNQFSLKVRVYNRLKTIVGIR